LAALIEREMNAGFSVGEARARALERIEEIDFEEEMALYSEFVGASDEALLGLLFPELSEEEAAAIVEDGRRDSEELMRSVHGRHWRRRRGSFVRTLIGRNFRPAFSSSWKATRRTLPARRESRRATRAVASLARAGGDAGGDGSGDGDSDGEPPRPAVVPFAPSTARSIPCTFELNSSSLSRRLVLPRCWRLSEGRCA